MSLTNFSAISLKICLLMVLFQLVTSAAIANLNERSTSDSNQAKLVNYMQFRNKIRCLLNGGLCDQSVKSYGYYDETPRAEKKPCLSGIGGHPCTDKDNDKEDLDDDFHHSYNNPGK